MKILLKTRHVIVMLLAVSVLAGYAARIDAQDCIVFSTITAAHYNTHGIEPDGTLWAWGSNERGQLGDGTTVTRFFPVQIGSDSDWVSVEGGTNKTHALKTDGTLWGWGRNQFGELGDGTMTDRHSPVQIGSDGNWASVTSGNKHTMALKTDRALWGWGRSNNGQLGDGGTIPDRPSPVQLSDCGGGPEYCSLNGFEPPVNSGPVTVRKNRVLPLKVELRDENCDLPIIDTDVVAPPVLQVTFAAGTPAALDVTDDSLTAGWGTEGNQFEYDISTGLWRFNLKTKNYTASGTYTISIVSGNVAEYTIDSSITATFVINN